MIGIGGTGFLTGNTENGIHVVVTHVGSLRGDVFRAESNWKALLVHCCCCCFCFESKSE